ncbi:MULTISPECIES: energy transducer TonB [unclassified Pseudomonas]|uniref:energy transducer TonB n=1 Tax=unclassified Pseudomonas TaxID=196821 RepID=UPI000D37AB23|nr:MULTISPECIES: energy transducer TonB [unclassified Pseudomonas]RAU43709.1 energy transducer TonB [Pseudomonas sp. RIT 409]RAU54359.1 energy transducer TonB [Pseudomonas sp. RIT 412]
MLNEPRRRAFLSAMQVVTWLPRTELPFAAPSRAELLAPLPVFDEVEDAPRPAAPAPGHSEAPVAGTVPVARSGDRPKIEVPRPSVPAKASATPAAQDDAAPVVNKAPVVPPPRFALQLLRAGSCLLLVELVTGEPFQSRDPSYLLLKDMLRAAGLPDSPQIVGEPVSWPLLMRGQMDQGPDAARDFVQGFLYARVEEAPCACLWLVGLPAIRFAGESDAESYNQDFQIDGLGLAWALPGLELLMDEPQRKADVWRAMRKLMGRWKSVNE